MMKEQAQFQARQAADEAHAAIQSWQDFNNQLVGVLRTYSERYGTGSDLAMMKARSDPRVTDLISQRDYYLQRTIMHTTMAIMHTLMKDEDE